MAPHLNEDGFEPALGFRVLEEVVSDPEHQSLPGLRSSSGFFLPRVQIQESRAAPFKLAHYLCGKLRVAVQCRLSPVRQSLPIDIARYSLAKAIRIHEL
jgi:hypothetical protein